MDVVALLLVAFVAGTLGGMVGVGGGVLFVPGLVVLMDLSQLEAEATSLVAVVAVGAVGAWRQHRYDNLRLNDALVIGLLSPVGVAVGVVAAIVGKGGGGEKAADAGHGALPRGCGGGMPSLRERDGAGPTVRLWCGSQWQRQ